MNYIERVFEKATIKGLANYLLYQEEEQTEDKGYEVRIDEAFSEFEEVAFTYDDRESKLINAMNKLAGEITDMYIEIGIQAGFLIMIDMMKKADGRGAKYMEGVQGGVYRQMYESLSPDISVLLCELQENETETVKQISGILRESLNKSKEIYNKKC